jgi:putative transposase
MPFVRVMIHAVWGTKNRLPYLTLDVKNKLIEHIKENARLKQIFIDTIYGHTEHLHCLIGLNADISIAKTMNLLKGESAYWMNRSGLLKTKFEWADEYFAISVSESVVAKVRRYILNQDEHHQRTTYAKEYNNFIVRYKFRSK